MHKRPRELPHVSGDEIIFTDSSDDDVPQPIALVPKRKMTAVEPEPPAAARFVSSDSIDSEDISILEQRLRQLLVEDAGPQQRVQTSPILVHLLKTHCNLPSGTLRSGQEEVVRSVLRGQSVLALFPTGYGKSLCYQLPMLVHRLIRACEKQRTSANDVKLCSKQKFAVVISPLLALISDQLGSIRRQDAVHAVSITSNTGRDMEERIYRTLTDGDNNAIDLVLVSPEAFVTKHRLRLVLRDCFDRIAFVCIDEAHCISSWSHDFRPTYLYLRKSLHDLQRDSIQRSPPILALTATAPASVVSELCDLLQLGCVVDRMQPRDNIILQRAVLPPLDMPVADRMRELQEQLLLAVKELAHPMLIYAPTQAQVDEFSGYLRRAVSLRVEGRGVLKRRCDPGATPSLGGESEKPLEVVAYHAGLPQSQRTIAQRRFLTGDADILVATVAFGMGIDKSNIRSVVHCTSPSSLAAYSQETGRAGRDGAQSVCRTIYDVDDFFLLRRKALTHLLSFSDVKKIISSLFASQTTTSGLAFLAVSTEQIAGEVGCSSATVETLMYLLLISHPLHLAALEGKIPLSFRVSRVDACDGDGDEDPNVPPSTASEDTSLHSSVSWAEQRRRDQHRRYDASLQGVLKQLDVSCEVERLCRNSVRALVPSIVQASNDAGLSVEDFLFRLRTLEASRTVSVRWSNYGFLLRCGPSFPPSSEAIQLIAKEMFQKLKARLMQAVTHIHDMFGFLESPSQSALLEGLARSSSGDAPRWRPPAPRITKTQAIDIANQFVSENRVRIRNATEVVKALAGIAPTMTGGGQGEGALAPLTGSWYLRHPHFGALQDFDIEWIMKVVAAHALPE